MTDSEGTTVGVVGDRTLTTAVEDAGAAAIAGAADDVLADGPEWIVAVGEAALSALAGESPSVPILAVDVEPGIPGVGRDGAPDAIDAILDGSVPLTERQRYVATVGGEPRGAVLRDAMLITDEPARISEYAVRSDDRQVGRLRADGVVVATPAGTPGYLSDAGGPVVEPGTGTLAVVPVAPFRTHSDHWVLDDAGVSLAVHRDEPVVLVTDGSERGRVPTDVTVEFVPDGELRLYAPGEDWKNSNGGRPE